MDRVIDLYMWIDKQLVLERQGDKWIEKQLDRYVHILWLCVKMKG